MYSLRRTAIRAPANANLTSSIKPSTRASPPRRLLQLSQTSASPSFIPSSSLSTATFYSNPLRSQFLPDEIRVPTSRSFHHGARLGQQKDAKPSSDAAKEEAAEGQSKEKSASSEGETGSKEETSKDDASKEDASKEEPGSEGGGKKEGQQEAPPPPPPHGDKSPWQVFTDTLQKEFQASKEWNESTKALAAGAQQFTESDSVRRAREAYEQTTGAVSSTTATVLKSTAGAVGKGAAWTWETPVVKGVRTTVNATASVIEKGTRPIRETEAFKNVKNVIDDGSSSRYGGWVEKEERRKARELREQQEAQKMGMSGGRVEVPTEDPK